MPAEGDNDPILAPQTGWGGSLLGGSGGGPARPLRPEERWAV